MRFDLSYLTNDYLFTYKLININSHISDLAEVAAVCRRVNFSHKEMEINIMGFDDLLMDIDRIWAEMEPFYANIPVTWQDTSNVMCDAMEITASMIFFSDRHRIASLATASRRRRYVRVMSDYHNQRTSDLQREQLSRIVRKLVAARRQQ